MALIAIPSEYRRCVGDPFYNAEFCEHGWPAIWLERQSITATTKVLPPSHDWQEKATRARQKFQQYTDGLATFRFAETEKDFSPQFSPPTASQFWTLADGWPWSSDGDQSFFRVRWWGLLFDLGIWILATAAIFSILQYYRSRNRKTLQISIQTGLVALVVLSTIGASYAYFDRQRIQQSTAIENLQRERSVAFDFTSNGPVWLDRITDYRFRPLWIPNSYRRAIEQAEVKNLGLFDRILAIRFSSWPDGDMVPLIIKPEESAIAINQFDQLENIWVECRQDDSISQLFSLLDGENVTYLNFSSSFQFDPHRTRITHFSNLEALWIENGVHVPAGFVKSFPNLKILTLRPKTIDDEVIDEILALKKLEQLHLGRFNHETFSQEQLKRLQDVSDSINLSFR